MNTEVNTYFSDYQPNTNGSKKKSKNQEKVKEIPQPQPQIQERMNIPIESKEIPLSELEDKSLSLEEKIKSFIEFNENINIVDELEELRRQVKLKYLSAKAINKEKEYIATKLFYFPTNKLATFIELRGKDVDSVLFKSIVMRHGDLNQLLLQTKAEDIKTEINYAMNEVRNWGSFYFDINKLEKIATHKYGDSMLKTYHIEFYALTVSFDSNISNSVTVKYENVEITPNDFKHRVLESIAERRLRYIATNVIYLFLKEYQVQGTEKKKGTIAGLSNIYT